MYMYQRNKNRQKSPKLGESEFESPPTSPANSDSDSDSTKSGVQNRLDSARLGQTRQTRPNSARHRLGSKIFKNL